MTDMEALRSGWLGDLPPVFAERLLSLGKWVHVPARGLVYRQGEATDDLYGIASGSIRMHLAMNEHEQRHAHSCGPGFWFGEYELVSGAPRMMEIDAAEDLRLMRIRKADFLVLAQSEPEAWRWIALLVAQHQALAIGAADDLMLSSVEKRVVAVLLRLTGHRMNHPASPPLRAVRITQQELAVAANLSRSSTGGILRKLKRLGEIAIDYGEIVVCEPEALAGRMA